MEPSRIQRAYRDHNRRMRIRLQHQNYMVRPERRALFQVMTPPVYGPTVPPEFIARETEYWFQKALLQSERDTMTYFSRELNSLRQRFPAITVNLFMAAQSVEEVGSLARIETPTWTNERLNLNQYYSKYFPWYAKNMPRFLHEASRASGLVPCDALSLIKGLMDPEHWKQIFSTIVADVSVEPHPHYQVINAEFMSRISPLIPKRKVEFLRCLNHIETDTWVIADISMYFSTNLTVLRPAFLRFPSGYLIQRITNGLSKVTILEHWVYEEKEAINLFSQNSEIGAKKWLTDLERHFYNTYLVSVPSIDGHIQSMFDSIYHTNLLYLSTVMVSQFCTGACGAAGQNWKRLTSINFPSNGTYIFTRETQDMSHVPRVIVSATSYAIMEVKPDIVFGSINRTNKGYIWDYLHPFEDMQRVIHIKRGLNPGNEVSVFKFEDWYMVQETYYEGSQAMIIHACVEASHFMTAINGGDFSGIDLLPCGFTIATYGQVGSLVSCGYQVMASQATFRSENVANYLKKTIDDTLRNVANVLSS